jgi:hypothetical protein
MHEQCNFQPLKQPTGRQQVSKQLASAFGLPQALQLSHSPLPMYSNRTAMLLAVQGAQLLGCGAGRDAPVPHDAAADRVAGGAGQVRQLPSRHIAVLPRLSQVSAAMLYVPFSHMYVLHHIYVNRCRNFICPHHK